MDHNENGWPLPPVYIMFDDIRMIEPVETKNSQTLFKVTAMTFEKPYQVKTFEIKMIKDINEVYTLINEGYKQAIAKKDVLIGI